MFTYERKLFSKATRSRPRSNPSGKVLICLMLVASACSGDGTDAPDGGLTNSDDNSVTPGQGDATLPVTTFDSGFPGTNDAALPNDAGVDGDAALDSAIASDAALVDGALPPAPDAAVPPADLGICHVPGNKTFVFGDSYIALSGDFTRLLVAKARAAKAIGANETYVDRAVSGASMAGVRGIPSQYTNAGYQLAIGDGGGNDILLGNTACLEKTSIATVASDASCVKSVADALTAAKTMFERMGKDGVKAVVYFFYPHLPGGGLLGGSRPNFVMDYAYPLAHKACDDAAGIKCFFVDMRKEFDSGMWTGLDDGSGKPKPGLIGIDSVHPTTAGSQLIADKVWSVMEANCLGSKP